MMTGAYFVGRKELLEWINKLLQLSPPYTKVEQLCSGAVFAQLLDMLAPGKSINMKKVIFNANQEYQYVENFKEVQNGFKRLGITKVLDVVPLTRASYQVCLEHLQWFKVYFESNCNPRVLELYDPVGRRNGQPAHLPSSDGSAVAAPVAAVAVATATAAAAAPVAAAPVAAAPVVAPVVARTTEKRSARSGSSSSSVPAASASPARAASSSAPLRNTANTASSTASKRGGTTSSSELNEMSKKLASLQLELDRAEQERDFYFAKLRDVEIWTQTHPDPNNHAVREVQSILYKTDE